MKSSREKYTIENDVHVNNKLRYLLKNYTCALILMYHYNSVLNGMRALVYYVKYKRTKIFKKKSNCFINTSSALKNYKNYVLWHSKN